MSIKVVARLVNDGEQDFHFGTEFLHKLARLERDGYAGKQLIDAAITDDWGPHPNCIIITGTDEHGNRVNRTIPYD